MKGLRMDRLAVEVNATGPVQVVIQGEDAAVLWPVAPLARMAHMRIAVAILLLLIPMGYGLAVASIPGALANALLGALLVLPWLWFTRPKPVE